MHVSLARRALFTGRFAARQEHAVRPPWALAEEAFLDACSRCDACIGACAEGILSRGGGGYPVVSFKGGACTFCRACVGACADKALTAAEPWDVVARIGEGCLSANGITCRVCGDRCDARAIRFQLAVGGKANPMIDVTACTGCGACVQSCPAAVITIEHMAETTAKEISS